MQQGILGGPTGDLLFQLLLYLPLLTVIGVLEGRGHYTVCREAGVRQYVKK